MKFFSRKCRSQSTGFQNGNKSTTGEKHTEKWKQETRERMKGNNWGFQKGKPSVFKGKKRENLRGKNHWNWKGGSSEEAKVFKSRIEYKLWREAVFARDNWTCQNCGKRDGTEIHPHHIRNFAEYLGLRTSIENGITFCKDCHKLFHKIYGKQNNTKEQLEEFLQSHSR